MKATRAYIASLGTTGVLLAASILMLTIVSTLVAFDGWPSGTLTERVDKLTLNSRAPAIPVSATVASAANAAAAGGAPAAGAPGGTGRGPAGNGGVGGERFASGPTGTTPSPGGVGGVTPPNLPNPLGDGGPEIPTIPVPGGDTAKESLASTTEQTTGAVGTAVGGPGGDLITTAGQTAADALRALPLGSNPKG